MTNNNPYQMAKTQWEQNEIRPKWNQNVMKSDWNEIRPK